jgi:hypothetical protein
LINVTKISIKNQEGMIMKNKKRLYFMLTLVLSCLFVGLSTSAMAKTKVVTLSKSSVEITVGKSKTINLKNAKKNKVVWTSSNKKVATVKNGKITGKNVGYATIKAKYKKITYTCSVEVKAKAVSQQKLSIEYTDTGSGVIAVVTNNNASAVDVKISCLYYNGTNMLDSHDDENYCIGSNETGYLYINGPYSSSTYENLSYTSYTPNVTVENSYYTSYAKKIDINAQNGADKIVATITNNSGKNLSTIKLVAVYYDVNGKIIGIDTSYADDSASSGASSFVNFYYPYDEVTYETIVPASFDVFVNYAYAY